ncbi:MAG: reverse transcriptase domain-containing protein [Desulfovibrionaceae bacterium]
MYLLELDREMERHDVLYIRFMDDILILSRTRWKMKRAVKAMNTILGRYGLDKHPRKTDMGRVERGFDFLGYRLSPGHIAMADKTLVNLLGRAFRLQERGRTRRETAPAASRSLGRYVRGWLWWCRRGLQTKPDKDGILTRTMALLQSLCEQALGGSWGWGFVASSLSVLA